MRSPPTASSNWNETFRRARDLMQKVGLKESPATLITNIGVGKQQLVEIAKALSKKVKLLILDEPTASSTKPTAPRCSISCSGSRRRA